MYTYIYIHMLCDTGYMERGVGSRQLCFTIVVVAVVVVAVIAVVAVVVVIVVVFVVQGTNTS